MTAFAWFGPKGAASDTERRLLAQFPEVSAETIWNGKFMGAFETYTLDQFPLRDSFRGLKSRFHYGILGQKDNNGIYIAEGSAVKQEYPLNERSLDYALDRFNYLYDKYLSDSRIYAAIVPDKGCYLAERTGNLAMDYEALFDRMEEGMPWAAHIDLRDILSAEDYYRTDTHWRQENLLPVAEKIADAMGVTVPEFTPIKQDRPFYGVYYGQAALP